MLLGAVFLATGCRPSLDGAWGKADCDATGSFVSALFDQSHGDVDGHL